MYGTGFALPHSDSSSMRGCTRLVKAYGWAKPSCKIHLLCFRSLNESVNLSRGKWKLLKRSARQHDEVKNHFKWATISDLLSVFMLAKLCTKLRVTSRALLQDSWNNQHMKHPYCKVFQKILPTQCLLKGTYTTEHSKNVAQPLGITRCGKCLLSDEGFL